MSAALAAALSAAAMVISFLVAFAMCRYAIALGFADIPNDRSLHTTSTPRAGGVGFALAVPVLTAIGLHILHGGIATPERALLGASAALGLVGLADDRYGLSVGLRLGAQFLAATAVAIAGGGIREIALPGLRVVPLAALAVPATIVWLVAVTNIFNFMDGIDGIAAVQAIVAAVGIGATAVHWRSGEAALAMAVLAGGVAGFLPLNWAPARVFMGDVGSTFLGFTLAGWAVIPPHGAQKIICIAALSPFLFDSTVTIVRRLLRGERVYEAHRTHFYQRLVSQGWSHGWTTIVYGLLAAVSASIAAVSILTGADGAAWLAFLVPLAIPFFLRAPTINRNSGSKLSRMPGRGSR